MTTITPTACPGVVAWVCHGCGWQTVGPVTDTRGVLVGPVQCPACPASGLAGRVTRRLLRRRTDGGAR